MANRNDQGTNIEPGIVARVAAGIRLIATGKGPEWFGPREPLKPIVSEEQKPSVQGRQFDFPVGINQRQQPRSGEAITFGELRALADSYDLMRIIIETRKDQLAKLRWTIKPKDKKAKPDDRCKQLQDFFASPDKEHSWDEWIRMLLEDLLVIDAPVLYPRRTKGGELYALEPMDGSTIKRVLDQSGRTPLPPEPAYQQVLKGVTAVNYSREELIYKPRNPRTHKVYGYSPVEQVIMTINIALRRQVHQLQYYTEGNVPEALVGVPDSWSVEQIKQFQEYWDALLQGETGERRRMRFTPGEIAKNFKETKQPPLKDIFDEWLARVVCFAFSIECTPFVSQINRAVAETVREQALSEGLAPLQNWVKGLIDYVLVMYFKAGDLEFDWDDEVALSPKEQAEINAIYLAAKVLHPDEVRADLGRDPLTPEQKAELSPPPPMMDEGEELDEDGEPLPPKKGDKKKEDKAGAKEEPAALGKSLKLVPINRERKAVRRARSALAKRIDAFLKAQASKIAEQMADGLGLAKAANNDSDSFGSWSVDSLAFTDWYEELPDLMTGVLSGTAQDGGSAALRQLGITDDDIDRVMRDRAEAWARQRAAEMVGMRWDGDELVPNPNARWQITEGTRELIRSMTETALEEGWSATDLADALGESYAFSESRARMIARTEIAKADVAGTMEGYRASGVVMGKQWLTADDEKVSEECQACADAGVIGLNDNFPGGEDAPPNHPNCRCAVVPVLDDEMPVQLGGS